MVAIHLAERGWPVRLIERRSAVLGGATQHANRLHLGFHYPRDETTARQCVAGYERFRSAFAGAILPGGGNAYCIASKGSLTSPEQFLAFCDRLGLGYREVAPAALRHGIRGVDLAVLTDEVMFDPDILRRLIADRLARSGAAVSLGADIQSVERSGDGGFVLRFDGGEHRFDGLVNCTYANVNRIGSWLGHGTETHQYEYTASPVIAFDDGDASSLTIMDGPFFGLLPLNAAGDTLLFHVDLSVIAREDRSKVDPAWLDPETAPFAAVDRDAWSRSVIEAASAFAPDIGKARIKGFREGPRMVLANVDDTDTRPSIVSRPEPGYVEVFSGKVVHAMWVGDEVERLLDGGAPVAGAA
jgi:glycine/D-amino acid oxidase-like deaminating enzyme